jgi:hypothetical protein
MKGGRSGGAGQNPASWTTWFASKGHIWWGPALTAEHDTWQIKGVEWWSDNVLETLTNLARDRYFVAFNSGTDAKHRIFLTPAVTRKMMEDSVEVPYTHFPWKWADVDIIHCTINYFGLLADRGPDLGEWKGGS